MCKCNNCNSDNIIKEGKKGKYNKQIYYCKDCKKYFSEGKDNRIKRDIKQRELCLLLYSHNMSMRSIQNTIEKFFNTKISFRLVDKWIKSANKLLNNDIKINSSRGDNTNSKPHKIAILEMDELFTKYYDLKKNEWKELKYGLLLVGTEIKLLHLN